MKEQIVNPGGIQALSEEIGTLNSKLSVNVYTGDANNMPDGIWSCNNTVTNLPTADYYTVECRNASANTAYQIAVYVFENVQYIRQKTSGAWGSWNRIALHSKKLNMLHKMTGNGNTFTITFTGNGKSAFMYGRFGYDWSLLSMAVIGHNEANAATIKCFGDQVATVSCSGHVVTVTTAENYANVTVVSDDDIS